MTAAMAGLPKGVPRYGLEPGLRIVRFAGAKFARRIDRTGGEFDLGEYVVLWRVESHLRKRVTGCDGIVAGAGQPRRILRFPRDQARHRGGAGPALRAG